MQLLYVSGKCLLVGSGKSVSSFWCVGNGDHVLSMMLEGFQDICKSTCISHDIQKYPWYVKTFHHFQYGTKWREIVSVVEWSWHLEQIRSSPGCDQYPPHHQNTPPTESHPMHFPAQAQPTANWSDYSSVRDRPFQKFSFLYQFSYLWHCSALWLKESWPITKIWREQFSFG